MYILLTQKDEYSELSPAQKKLSGMASTALPAMQSYIYYLRTTFSRRHNYYFGRQYQDPVFTWPFDD